MTSLTNSELQAQTQACLVEIERRLAEAGKDRLLKRAKTAHALLDSIEEKLFDNGDIASRSVAGDKE